MSKKVTEITHDLVTPILAEEQLELVDIEYKKEGTNWFLRVFIDREGTGVDIEDCGKVSEKLSKKLDETDPIPNPYYLEVSSPGAERPLKKVKDFEKAIGKQVFIKTYEPINNAKEFQGVLLSVADNDLTVQEGKQVVKIPMDKVASARLSVVF